MRMYCNKDGCQFYDTEPPTNEGKPAIGRGALLPLIFGIISLLLAFLLISTGVLARTEITVVAEISDTAAYNYMAAYYLFFSVLTLLSITAAIISFIMYAKSRKENLDIAGLIISIGAIAVTCIGMIYNFYMLGTVY